MKKNLTTKISTLQCISCLQIYPHPPKHNLKDKSYDHTLLDTCSGLTYSFQLSTRCQQLNSQCLHIMYWKQFLLVPVEMHLSLHINGPCYERGKPSIQVSGCCLLLPIRGSALWFRITLSLVTFPEYFTMIKCYLQAQLKHFSFKIFIHF